MEVILSLVFKQNNYSFGFSKANTTHLPTGEFIDFGLSTQTITGLKLEKREDWETKTKTKTKHNEVVVRLHTKIRILMARLMGFTSDLKK